MRGVNWTEEAGRAKKAAEALWKRNGWTDESDVFARDLVGDVAAIPPWDVTARLNLMSHRVAERYGLSPEQARVLQGSMFREAGRILGKNSRTILELGREMLANRGQGRPYTPEQVAQWAKALPPLLADAEQSVGTLVAEVDPQLDEEHRDRLKRDLASAERRAKYVSEAGARWAAGDWRASDWGLEDDPIQKGEAVSAAIPLRPVPSAPPAVEPEVPGIVIPTKWVDYDPKTWIAYRLEVEKRYGLDAGQRTAARSIHDELVARALDFAGGRREELSAIAVSERSTHPSYEPIRTLFAELRDRLEALPTTSQRESSPR